MHRFLRSGDRLCVSQAAAEAAKYESTSRSEKVASPVFSPAAIIWTTRTHLCPAEEYSLHVFGDLRPRQSGRSL